MFIWLVNHSQTKLANDIYMEADPTHTAKIYKNILFKTNADGRVNDAIIEILTNRGYNTISYNSLFPAIRQYSSEEIEKVLKEKQIDMMAVVDIQSVNAPISNNSFSAYNIGNTMIFSGGGNMVNMFFTMFLYDIGKDNPFVKINGKVFSDGLYSKRARPLTIKFFNKALNGLYKNNVITHPEKVEK